MMKRQTITGSTLRARPDAHKACIARELEEKVWPLLASKKSETCDSPDLRACGCSRSTQTNGIVATYR